jgi:hypothetical protein
MHCLTITAAPQQYRHHSSTGATAVQVPQQSLTQSPSCATAPEPQLADVLALLSRWLPANMGQVVAGSSGPLGAVAGEESRLVASISTLLMDIEGAWAKLQSQLSEAKVGVAGQVVPRQGVVCVLWRAVQGVHACCCTCSHFDCDGPAVLPCGTLQPPRASLRHGHTCGSHPGSTTADKHPPAAPLC